MLLLGGTVALLDENTVTLLLGGGKTLYEVVMRGTAGHREVDAQWPSSRRTRKRGIGIRRMK